MLATGDHNRRDALAPGAGTNTVSDMKDNAKAMPARLTLKAINSELSKRGYNARLEKASGYFYFLGGEATDWIDRTVQVPNVSALTLEQWMDEFRRLKKLNAEIVRTGGKTARARKPTR